MKASFPNIYKALNDEKRPALSYAIIEDGKIVATNGSIMIYSDFANYVQNPELAERKVFDSDLLKWMTGKNFNRLECTEKGIIAYSTKGIEEKPYSGHFEYEEKKFGETTSTVRSIYLGKNDGSMFHFPNWKSVLPNKDNYKKSEGVKDIAICTKSLAIISECFIYESELKSLKFEFYTNDRAILISPNERTVLLEQQAILMPVIIND